MSFRPRTSTDDDAPDSVRTTARRDTPHEAVAGRRGIALSDAPPPARPAAAERGAVEPRSSSVFQESWWLETTSRGAIEEVRVEWDGLTVAALSFVRRTRAGLIRILAPPPFTHTLGPRYALPVSKPTQHAMNVARVVRELRAKLPPHDKFHQQLDPEDKSAFAFALAGCSVGQLFTFRIEPDRPPAELLAAADPATRRLVRSGQRSLVATAHPDVDRFLSLALLERTEQENRHDFDLLALTCQAAISRGRGTILTVEDEAGQDLASVFLVWDERVLYYLVPFRDKARARSTATAFLIWEAMLFAQARGLIFDFDGYSSIGSARFLASFGIPPIIRSLVTYRSPRFVMIDFLRTAWRPRGPAGMRIDFDFPVAAENARLPGPR